MNNDFRIIDNKAKTTLLAIHGFSSSKDFIKDLGEYKNNFNIVTYTYDPEGKADFEKMYQTAKDYLKRIKHSKVVILGHSLGGAVAARLAHEREVKEVFFMSPFHPHIVDYKGYKALRMVTQGTIAGKIIKAVATRKDPFVDKFLNHTSPWYDLVLESLLDKMFLEELDNNYKTLDIPVHFLVGDNDMVISTQHLINYVSELNRETEIIGKGHNPLSKPVYEWLNELIPFKKRMFFKFRKIFK